MDTSMALICTAAGSAAIWQASRWRTRRPKPQRRRQSLLKPHARYCYSQLRAACAEEISIQIDIPLARLLAHSPQPKKRRKSHRTGWGRVDFVLCDSHTLRPRLAVLIASSDEVPARSHSKTVEKQLESAQVAYIVLDPEREFEPDELSEMIEAHLEEEPPA